jgi:cytochrome b pre-mRNA-processing protein 3
MLRAFKARATLQRKASDLYGAIVTQARHPDFYAKLGIPDTPSGRYEMVVLHLFLVVDRLRTEGAQAGTLPRTLIEAFVVDMDDSLREMGTGDVAVAKKVRRAAAGLYDRSKDYREALAADDAEELARLLARHGLVRDADGARGHALARYVHTAAAYLADQDGADLLAGRIAFPAVTNAEDVR